MRNMSFSMTTEQVRAKTKTVTRRRGWWFLRPGDMAQPVVKAMGLKKGEHIEKINGPIRVVSVCAQSLSLISPADVEREGFIGMPPQLFITMLCDKFKIKPQTVFNRIEFEYV